MSFSKSYEKIAESDLEKLTYQKLGDTKELSVKAEAVESRFSSEDDIPKG